MKFVLHRNRVVASTMGLSIHFTKGEPAYVPPFMYQEVIAAGGVPEEELDEDDLKVGNPNKPSDADAQMLAIFEVFEKLALRNVREEFTAGGQPHLSVLAKELGWNVTAKERDVAWAEFRVTGGKDD